jgi:hydrogenase/urease accessory protein HupE
MRFSLRVLLALALALVAGVAPAHEMSMAEMEVRQISRDDFLWQWTATSGRPAVQELTPAWPEGCRAELNLLHCGERGLRGTLEMQGVGERYSAAIVKVVWLDGPARIYTLTARQPRAQLHGAAEDQRGLGEIASAYVVLGIEHILTGLDHLMFVIGLLFLVGFERRLVWTITAFTAAHSLTLASSALGLLTLRPPPVEATIALSIVLVAAEALHRRQTLARRWPALVAFLFGLVHGLGFAGALQEIGLPERHLWVALLTFNAGVEIGQLAVVAAAAGVMLAARRLPRPDIARRATLYAIGSVAAWWSIARVVAMAG